MHDRELRHRWRSFLWCCIVAKLTFVALLLQSGMRWLESTYQQKARAWVVRFDPLSPSRLN